MDELVPARQERGLVRVDPAAVAAAETAKARIQSAYIMAYRKPRSEDQSRARILEACKRPGFAEKVEYSKPVAGRSIKGPSIRFAELALREWGNVLTETQVIYEDENVRRVKVAVIDLETNTTFSKEIQIAKTVERKQITPDRELMGERINTYGQQVFIVKSTDEELQNKEAAAISKVIRNEGLRLIPTDIIDEGTETARQTLRDKDAKDPKAAKKKVLDSFDTLGIKPRDLEKLLRHPLDTVSPAELEDLRKIYQAIKDGEASWADYISEPQEGEEGPSSLKAQQEKVKEKLEAKKRGRPAKAPLSPQEGGEGIDTPPHTGLGVEASPGADKTPPVGVGQMTMAAIRGILADKSLDLALYYEEKGIREIDRVPLEELTREIGQDILDWLKRQ